MSEKSSVEVLIPADRLFHIGPGVPVTFKVPATVVCHPGNVAAVEKLLGEGSSTSKVVDLGERQQAASVTRAEFEALQQELRGATADILAAVRAQAAPTKPAEPKPEPGKGEGKGQN